MSKTPAKSPTPSPVPQALPLPTSGGSWERLKDGSLKPIDAPIDAQPALEPSSKEP